ncbi:hypothetical protein ALC60_01400 [Trachymyrmex zeteki]|uniref:Uncharacterized protein n=1 Tax=Mycetomoellerius zeteki TaxID=64791 RepID=A0A151XGP6_9HYME|nr:hypothetical protein ALC60_01400 [Trachymyrmex zeteki]
MLSSCDVTGLVKNALPLCVRSVPFIYKSISRSRYRCRRAEMQSESAFVWSEIQSATLFHRAIVTLQLLELTSRGFAVRLFSEYLVSYVSFREIFVPRISYIVFSARHVQQIYACVTSSQSLF